MRVNKIIKFSAAWCGPCRQLKKELENFDLVPIIEYDVDENEELCNKYKIKNIPTLVFLDENDNEIGRNIGFILKSDLLNKINSLNG